MSGQAGNDALSGGPGDDTLVGGYERDFMHGNAGDDEFLASGDFGAIDTILCSTGFDVVTADTNDRFMNQWTGITDPAGAGCEQVFYAP